MSGGAIHKGGPEEARVDCNENAMAVLYSAVGSECMCITCDHSDLRSII